MTTDPERQFELAFSDPVTLGKPSGAQADGPSIALPAEAFIRLVYGRLDPDHTPPVVAKGVDLDALRRSFPGG
jgi:hypothetical protein